MDTKDINAQNLLFLLSAAPLSIGCVITTGDDVATTDPTGSATSGNTSGATDNPTGGATDNPTGGGGSGSSTAAVDSSGTAADSTTNGNLDSPCEDYAYVYGECIPDGDPVYALESCEMYADYVYGIDVACLGLFEDALACLTALSCDEFVLDTACEAELLAVETCVTGG